MTKITFKVEGMHCQSCAERLDKVLGKEPGVHARNVSFAEGTATITFNPAALTKEHLRQLIERAGFTAGPEVS